MKKSFSTTWRLALSYLAIIMTLSLLFSAVLFMVLSSKLNQPLPPPDGRHMMERGNSEASDFSDQQQARLRQRDEETRRSVLVALGLVNVSMLIGGTAFSYYLARRTLRPIEAAMQQQAQFVADASHELRTPLAALLLKNEVALRKKSLDNAKIRSVLQHNVREIEALRDLSNSLLGLAQAEVASGQKQRTSLYTLIQEVKASFSAVATDKGVVIETTKGERDDKATAVVAPAVRQIISVLLDNAIKYAPATQGHVTISLTAHAHASVITVADNGPGIAPADQKRIFERFYRADAARTRKDASGYGLGLSIAKTVADAHGYQLTVASRPGKGTAFTLKIPK